MRGGFDFSSWQGVLTTVLGLSVITLVMVGIRLLVMQTVQQRRQRENRQINERLKILIAAYKTLGGSFTGNLLVDPAHRRDLRRTAQAVADAPLESDNELPDSPGPGVLEDSPAAERRRRIRDAVEAALSDVILLGTEEQVRLAAKAANDMVAGRSVEIAELVVSLRNFIREVLDLEPVPSVLVIPKQGPVRPASGAARGGGKGDRDNAGGRGRGGAGGGAAGGLGVGAGGGIDSDSTVDSIKP